METRLYFVFGDLLSNMGTGAVVAAVGVTLLSDTWPLPVAMSIGMFGGSLLAMLLASGLSLLFGAFETMLPVMTTGMLVGMMSGMATSLGLGMAVGAGSGLGLLVVVATYILDMRIRSRGRWTP